MPDMRKHYGIGIRIICADRKMRYEIAAEK